MVDDAEFQGLASGVGLGFEDGCFKGVNGASTNLGDGAHLGGGVLECLAFERFREFRALPAYRAGCADVGGRGHDGDVGCRGDECSGGRGTPAAGRYVDDDGHRGVKDDLHHAARGTEQATGGVECDYDELCPGALGVFDGALDVAFGDGANDGIHLDDVGGAGLGKEGRGEADGDQQQARREQHDSRPDME